MLSELLYNFSINIYYWLIKLASVFNKKAKLWIDGQQSIFNKQLSITNKFEESENSSLIPHRLSLKKTAWFHCASLGEFEQGRPVIEAFRKEFTDYRIVLTFFSPSGYEVRKNYEGADFISYLPIDTLSNTKKFIDLIKPSIVFFVKYEFWRNYIFELKKRKIPMVSFSTIFRKNQIYFKQYGGFFREILHQFNHILVQNQESADMLKSIDYQSFTVVGDTRFDRVKQITETIKEIEIATRFTHTESKTLIIGSAWQEDIDCVFEKLLTFKYLKFIIAPHEIHDEQIKAWQKQIGLKSIRFSEVKNHRELSDYQCLIIDNIGLLSSLYQYADFAFIGGGFGKGLHNILEAATFGIPIFFGNKSFQKFKEAKDLIEFGGAIAVKDSKEFYDRFNEFLSDENSRKQKGDICRNYVVKNTGATEKVIKLAKQILKLSP